MARYLISFDEGTMQVPDDQLPAVGEAAHRVVDLAKEAGVWVTGGGVLGRPTQVVAVDGTVSVRPYPDTKASVGGFSIVDVPTLADALQWAGRLAVACRCPQEVRELGDDPDV